MFLVSGDEDGQMQNRLSFPIHFSTMETKTCPQTLLEEQQHKLRGSRTNYSPSVSLKLFVIQKLLDF